MNRAIRAAMPLLITLAVGFGAGTAWMSHSLAVKPAVVAVSRTNAKPVGVAGGKAKAVKLTVLPSFSVGSKGFSVGPNGVAKIDGTITSAEASPDFSRIAIAAELDKGAAIAMFDPQTKRILAFHKCSEARSIRWSPDSRWAAAIDEYNTVIMGRDGQVRVLPASGSHHIWRASRPGCLVCCNMSEVLEYDLAAGTERVLRDFSSNDDSRVIGLFNTKQSLRAAIGYTIPSSMEWDRIDVVDLDTGVTSLSVPCGGWTFDWADFEMSPNGEAYFLMAGQSAGCTTILGCTMDSTTTFKYRHRALVYDDGMYCSHTIRWSPNSGGSEFHINNAWTSGDALLDNDQLISLWSGQRWRTGYFQNPRCVTWWKDGAFLTVGDDGLYTEASGRLGDLILRHKL